MSKIGRNDPCPCGSGLKYKRCCLSKDEEKARQFAGQATSLIRPWEQVIEALPLSTEESEGKPDSQKILSGFQLPSWEPDSPVEVTSAQDELWERFEAAEYESRIAIFHETLAGDLLDEEMAFGMLSDYLFGEARERGQMQRFAGLVAALATQAPDIYEADAVYYSGMLLGEAIRTQEFHRLPALLDAFARQPAKGIDEFSRARDALMYYGQLQPLKDVMLRAWPLVSESAEIMPWGINEFRDTLGELIILDYLETAEAPRSDDPALLAQLAPYGERESERFRCEFAAIKGEWRHWKPHDFTPKQEHNCYLLSLEWLGDLRRRHDIPFTKGELARDALVRFFGQKGKPGRAGADFLVPKRKPLDQFLAKSMMNLIFVEYYEASALVELLPLYLTFLIQRELLREEAASNALRELRPLVTDFVRTLTATKAEPLVIESVQRRWP